MQSDAMPSGEVLRQTTCLVAENMFGSAFDAASAEAANRPPERMVALRLDGSPDFAVVLGWQKEQLSGLQHLFCGDDATAASDEPMVLDALGELLNIVAGQLKTELALEHKLGLPKFAQDVPAPVGSAAYSTSSGWVQQRGGGPELFIGAFPSAALGLVP